MFKSAIRVIAFASIVAFSTVSASAAVLVVDAQSGPWDTSISGNPYFGGPIGEYPSFDPEPIDANIFPNHLPAAWLPVVGGQLYTITYLSGLTDSFNPEGTGLVDATGYPDFTGPGTYGNFPVNTSNLNALIGAFTDSTGLVLAIFAPGNGPYEIAAPTGATRIQFGMNDDHFRDNGGSLEIDVTAAVPEPSTWAMILLGFGAVGFAAARRSRRADASSVA